MVWEGLITQQHCAGTGACHTTEEEEGVVVWSMYKQSALALSGWGPPSAHASIGYTSISSLLYCWLCQ